MKKILLTMTSFLILSQAQALTMERCNSYFTKDLANMMAKSIALGGDSGLSNPSCLNEASALNVTKSEQDLSGIAVQHITKIEVKSVAQPDKDAPIYVAVYEAHLADSKSTLVRGSFEFMRHTRFADPESIETYKCATITQAPNIQHIYLRCR